MYEQIIPWVPWVAVGLLAILCLPVAVFQKPILELTAWVLRLAMLVAYAIAPMHVSASQTNRYGAVVRAVTTTRSPLVTPDASRLAMIRAT